MSVAATARRPTRRSLAWLLALAGLCVTFPARAQATPSAAEYQIKAAYLVKFLGFIDWPAQAFDHADAPLVVGVLGAATLTEDLVQGVAGRRAGGRPIAVREFKPGEALNTLHVLFVARSHTARLPAMVAVTKEHPLLVITESEDAMPRNSAINFVVVEDRVRFDIALQPLERAGLRVSARLLTVARKVLPAAS